MKKLLALVLVMVMVTSLTACEDNGEPPATTETSAVVESKWPTSQVQIYIPLKAGGGTDIMGRYITEAMADITGANFAIINQNEGGGAVCFNNVQHASKDCDIIGFYGSSYFTSYVSGTHESSPDVYKCAAFIDYAVGGSFIVVSADSPYQTFEDLIAAAKENPGTITVGIQLGSYTHYQFVEIAKNAGAEFKYVEAGSDAEKVTAVLGGHVDVSLVNANQTNQYVEAGSMRALCCVSKYLDTLKALQNVPTITELGYPAPLAQSVLIFVVPACTDDATIAKINKTVNQAVAREDVIKKIATMGYVLNCYDTEGSQKMYENTYTAFRDIAKSIGALSNGR